MGAPTNILDAISEADTDMLQRVAEEVNSKFFKGTITIKVRWGIPSASESREPQSDIQSLPQQDLDRVVVALQHFQKGEYEAARDQLKPLVERGLREPSQLYQKVLMRLKDESWPDVARKINRLHTDTLLVAPGSTEMTQGEELAILIHPLLSASAGNSAPKYVIAYVIYHEMLHIWWKTTPDNPHPPLFRRMDKTFPDREKGLRWLRAASFTTIEDAIL